MNETHDVGCEEPRCLVVACLRAAASGAVPEAGRYGAVVGSSGNEARSRGGGRRGGGVGGERGTESEGDGDERERIEMYEYITALTSRNRS